MACCCDRAAIAAACVELFHARMAQLYDGLEVPVAGGGAWWTGSWDGSRWSGVRFEARGGVAAFGYANGVLEARITYNLEELGTWEQVNGA